MDGSGLKIEHSNFSYLQNDAVQPGVDAVRAVLLFVALVVAVMVGCEHAAAAQKHMAAAAQKHMVLYGMAASEQYVNNQDDRARGEGNNPFGNFSDVTAVVQKSGNGPFAGDEAIFVLNVYSSPALRSKTGTATFTCQYGFQKHGFCDAAFSLPDGKIYGSGDFSFDATTFTIPITGGSGKYEGAKGTMIESAASNHTQRLAFALN